MKYRFSFTGASALIPEFSGLASVINKGKDIGNIESGMMGRERSNTNNREFQELRLRARTLTPKQLQILAEGDYQEKQHITHLALCKAYRIYFDFVCDAILSKIQVFDYELTELDYFSFINKKSIDRPELEKLADSTRKKVKQVIFLMLKQVGIIESISNPAILIPDLSTRVEAAIREENADLLACFLNPEKNLSSRA